MRPLFPGPRGLQEFIWGQRLVHVDAVEAVCGHTAIVTVTSEPLQTLWAPHSPLRSRTAPPLWHLRKVPVVSMSTGHHPVAQKENWMWTTMASRREWLGTRLAERQKSGWSVPAVPATRISGGLIELLTQLPVLMRRCPSSPLQPHWVQGLRVNNS